MTRETHAGVPHPSDIKGIDTLKHQTLTSKVQERLENDCQAVDSAAARLQETREVLFAGEPDCPAPIDGWINQTPDGTELVIEGPGHKCWLVAEGFVPAGDRR